MYNLSNRLLLKKVGKVQNKTNEKEQMDVTDHRGPVKTYPNHCLSQGLKETECFPHESCKKEIHTTKDTL